MLGLCWLVRVQTRIVAFLIMGDLAAVQEACQAFLLV